jgi:hypothetical protein
MAYEKWINTGELLGGKNHHLAIDFLRNGMGPEGLMDNRVQVRTAIAKLIPGGVCVRE